MNNITCKRRGWSDVGMKKGNLSFQDKVGVVSGQAQVTIPRGLTRNMFRVIFLTVPMLRLLMTNYVCVSDARIINVILNIIR